jgi:hypothetical protein
MPGPPYRKLGSQFRALADFGPAGRKQGQERPVQSTGFAWVPSVRFRTEPMTLVLLPALFRGGSG